jgi:hypothetical protein
MEHKLPDEETIIKLYKFRFAGLEQPVIIEAFNNNQARILLKDALRMMPPEYGLSKVIDETVVTPVVGVSQIIQNGRPLVWVGKETSDTGWIDKEEYEKNNPGH